MVGARGPARGQGGKDQRRAGAHGRGLHPRTRPGPHPFPRFPGPGPGTFRRPAGGVRPGLSGLLQPAPILHCAGRDGTDLRLLWPHPDGALRPRRDRGHRCELHVPQRRPCLHRGARDRPGGRPGHLHPAARRGVALRLRAGGREPRTGARGLGIVLPSTDQMGPRGLRGAVLGASTRLPRAGLAAALLVPDHRHLLPVRAHDPSCIW